MNEGSDVKQGGHTMDFSVKKGNQDRGKRLQVRSGQDGFSWETRKSKGNSKTQYGYWGDV